MTQKEITIIYNENIIKMQDVIIRKLMKQNSFFGLPNFRNRELNRESVMCLKQMLKILKRNYKKDLKNCENETVEDTVTADKVEEMISEKVEQADF